MKPLSEVHDLIVCAGRTMDRVCVAAIAEINRRYPQYYPRFVMTEWITQDQLAEASVFWVVDQTAGLSDIQPALSYGIPLLVPELSTSLKQACIRGNFGLFYHTDGEAIACLIYLFSNPATKESLARNARASAATAGVR